MQSRPQLVQLRRSHGLSQQELAVQIGTTRLNISRWERGTTTPTPYFREKLVQFFGKDASELGLVSLDEQVKEKQRESSVVKFVDPGLPFPTKTGLIGRAKLIEELVEDLCGGYYKVALSGLPGVGKTALAVELAYHPRVQSYFEDGILWVGLGQKPKVVELLSRWGNLLSLTSSEMRVFTTRDEWARALHDRIGEKKMLLIIDDAWDIREASSFCIGGRRCAHIVTTRLVTLAYSFAEEKSYAVRELSQEDSVSLLRQLAPQTVLGYPEQIKAIVKSVDGLPLALTLLGKHLAAEKHKGQIRRLRSALEQVLDNTEIRLAVTDVQLPWEGLSTWPVASPLSLERTIAMSVSALPEQAQTVLQALALFPAKPDSFPEQIALAVCNAPVEMIDLLVDSGLIESNQPERYQLHQTIADYAKLSGIDSEVEQRYVTAISKFAYEHRDDDMILEQNISMILSALELSSAKKMYSVYLQIIFALSAFIEKRRLYALAEVHLARAQQFALELNRQEEVAYSYFYQGNMAYSLGDLQVARQKYQSSLEIARVLQHKQLMGKTLTYVGGIDVSLSYYTQATVLLNEALQCLLPCQDWKYISTAYRLAGETADALGNSNQADEYYSEAVKIAKLGKHRDVLSALLQNMGVKAARKGDYQRAAHYYQEGLLYALEDNDLQRQSAIMMNQGMLAYHQGDYKGAIHISLESLHIANTINQRICICSVLQNLGIFEGMLSHLKQAHLYVEQSLTIAKEIGHAWLYWEAKGVQGDLFFKQNKLDEAERVFNETLQAVQELQTPLLIAYSVFGLARVKLAQGETAMAYDYAMQAKEMYEKVEDVQHEEVSAWLLEHFPDAAR